MNPKYDGYKRRLASMIYNFLIRKLLVVLLKVKFMSNQELAEEMHQLLESLKNEKYTDLLKTTFGVPI